MAAKDLYYYPKQTTNKTMLTTRQFKCMLEKHKLFLLPVRFQSTSNWISHFANTLDMPENKSENRAKIESFWEGALKDIYEETLMYDNNDVVHSPDECVDPETRKIKVPKSEFVKTYKNSVFSLLDRYRYENNDAQTLESLQREIEDLTLNFSEDSIYKTSPNIMVMLTKNNLPSAKEFLRGKYLMDKEYPGRMTIYAESRSGDSLETSGSELSDEENKNLRCVLSESDKSLLVELGEHSIECLLVHTLGHLFNLENIVSLASLVDRIERNVRDYASSSTLYYNSRVCNLSMDAADKGTKASKTRAYPFGTALVEFLVSRGLLRLVTYNVDLLNFSDDSGPKTVVKNVVKKGHNYYRSSLVYAECLFNPALLPIKLNLPMVFPPKDWEPHKPEQKRKLLHISDIYGGYLSNPTGQIYSTQRSMSSPDAKNFFIYFENRELLEECGYLMPEFLSKDASASAYQLMAYFLLDKNFAKLTNLFDTGSANSTTKDLIVSLCQDLLPKESIRAHFEENIPGPLQPLKEELLEEALSECIKPSSGEIDISNLPVKSLSSTSRKYPKNITVPRKSGNISLRPFLVADTETIINKNSQHVPYAVGVMVVNPGIPVSRRERIDTYFSEDYSSRIFPTFEERSCQMLKSFIFRVAAITRQNRSAKTIYFHNLGRFDGIFLLKHLALYHPNYTVTPLMRDNRLYEVAVYSKKRLLFTFRDSLHLLPGKLDDLAKNLCPELGSKGSISYEDVRLESLSIMKESLLEYMEQDILLLGGIMQSFQDIYYKAYQADIVNKLTIASLALSLFREKYYDYNKHRIHIPNQNEDTFIRRGYYGGHTDAYLPYGTNLYYYDVNSLYPFVMKEFSMPGGTPVWHSDLEYMTLDNMFGFIEAYVECPKSINKPFLPYGDNKDGTLIFPTGTFVGVYYSEELKYARDIGYTIIPICGYLFEEMESPFKDYINSLFESRSNAKKKGNNALSFVYKLLMNSLYGRFGINPQSTKTEMCNKSKRDRIFRRPEFIDDVFIREDLYMVSYLTNPGKGPSYWDPPKNSAVQLAAAITAGSRIYMYKYISREDCLYTDTDSIVLGNPLPEEDVSSSVLGKFKLEDKILEGFFLAPKCYSYTTEESDGNKKVYKYKGPGRNVITPEWYKEQYADPSRSLIKKVTYQFRPDWKELSVKKKESTTTLRTLSNSKRIPFFNEKGKYVSTDPLDIDDLSSLNYIGTKLLESFKRKTAILEKENSALSQKLQKLEQERGIIAQRRVEEGNNTEDNNTLEQNNA
ncbi:DNA polymerase [Glycine soja]